MERVRVLPFLRAVTLLLCSAVALAAVGPAAARTDLRSTYGGTLTVGLFLGLPPSLDATLATPTVSSNGVFATFCQKLYDIDARDRIVPQLAAALPAVSGDKLTYTIPLRTGLEFNDGTPFDAPAVVTTLERDMTLPGSLRASDLASVSSVAAPDRSTVVIHLSSRFTPLPSVLATLTGAIMSPAELTKLGANFAGDPVCVGPFMFDHQVAGSSITLVKSPYFYDRYAVHLDKIVFAAATDAAAGLAALQAGDLQVLDNISFQQLATVKSDSSLRLYAQNGVAYNVLYFNLGNRHGVGNLPYSTLDAPFASSPSLRRAFEEAIDRSTLARVVGGGEPGCSPIPPANNVWYDPAVACTPYDPADAKKLVAAAGVSNLTVHLLYSAGGNLLLAQFIQAEEAKVGINVVIDSEPIAIANADAANGNFDLFMIGSPGTGDPDSLFFGRLDTAGATNDSGYSSPRLDLLLANARKATSVQARRTLYRAALATIATDRPAIYLWNTDKDAAVSTRVKGVEYLSDAVVRVAFAQYA
jgi:peptide/nickel transport system substrate-binding protein